MLLKAYYGMPYVILVGKKIITKPLHLKTVVINVKIFGGDVQDH